MDAAKAFERWKELNGKREPSGLPEFIFPMGEFCEVLGYKNTKEALEDIKRILGPNHYGLMLFMDTAEDDYYITKEAFGRIVWNNPELADMVYYDLYLHPDPEYTVPGICAQYWELCEKGPAHERGKRPNSISDSKL